MHNKFASRAYSYTVMVEIPKNLLERTKARRIALGLDAPEPGTTDSGEGASTATETAAPPGNSPAPAPPIGTAPSLPPTITGPVQTPPMKHKLPWFVLLVLGFLPIWAIFYYGSLQTKGKETTTATTDVPGAVIVAAKNFAFNPTGPTAKVDQVVEFKNEDNGTPHTLTFKDGSVDTGAVNGGAIKTFKVSKAGTYQFDCTFHPAMVGTFTVTQ